MLRLAIRMLVGDTTKVLGVVLGVLFCTFLCTHMLSMFAGMMERSFALVSDIPQADIWVMDPTVEYVDEPAGLPPTALERVQSIRGVAWGVPLYTGSLRARLPGGRYRGVLVIGIDDATLMGAPASLSAGSLAALRGLDAVIADVEGAKLLLRLPEHEQVREPGWNLPDFSAPTRPLRVGDELFVNDHRVVVVGMAELGARFLAKPILYTTYSRAREIAPPERNLLSYVLVKAKPGERAEALAERIQNLTGLRARTRRQFQTDTFWYYVRTTGVVGRIAFMVGLGVVVGSAVSGLLLYVFTMDNLKYYATFKALGARNRTIVAMVMTQAGLCGALGYGLGVGLSAGLSHVISARALPYLLLWPSMAFVGVTVVLICAVSAAMSARRVLQLEPAVVFK